MGSNLRKRVLAGRIFAVALAFVMVMAYWPLAGSVESFADEESTGDAGYYALPDEGESGDSGFVAVEDSVAAEELDDAIAEMRGDSVITSEGEIASADEDASGEADSLRSENDQADIETAGAGDGYREKLESLFDEGMDDVLSILSSDSEENEGTAFKEGSEALLSDCVILVYVGEEDSAATAFVGKSTSLTDKTFSDLFDSIYIDDSILTEIPMDAEAVDDLEGYQGYSWWAYNFDMTDFPVGYHNVILTFVNGIKDENDNEYSAVYEPYVPTYIYSAPSISLSDFYTGYNCLTFYNYNYDYDYDEDCDVYLAYRKGSGSWNTGLGPVSYGYSLKKTGISAASAYSAYAYYAKQDEYCPYLDDASYVEKNWFNGPASGTVSFKTGYVKTPVKSLTVKCRKQYCKKYKVRRLSSKIYYRYGYAGWGYYRKVLGYKTYKYWYTKVKVTVKMKKKPGVAGIYIGTKKASGNKKTYSKNFTLSGKKKGKKIKVSVQSYMSTTYGGWSKVVTKKYKVNPHVASDYTMNIFEWR